MLNHFLATLDGNPIAPVGVLWPSFTEQVGLPVLREHLFGQPRYRQQRFLTALELLILVEESSLMNETTKVDPRVSYTRGQVIRLLSSIGSAIQSVGATTTSALNLNLIGEVAYGDWELFTSDGLTYRVSNELGSSNTTVTFSGAGVSSVITSPDRRVSFYVTGGQPAANSAWSVVHWTPSTPSATRLVTTFDVTAMRGYVRTDLLDLYDTAPLMTERIAVAIVSLGNP